MARDDRGWGTDLGAGNRSDARLSDLARQPFNRYDRSIFDPEPRDTRNPPRAPNRQYNRYFSRSARR
jgi:hypothetical protein